jgi:di/tricarboxylate transporter
MSSHITIISSIGAILSSIINNIAALALLMPIDLQVAKKAKRTVKKTLMPLSFATILGGMVTLVGTPPNIIISAIRQKNLGEPFSFFDFTPVGITVCLAGLLFISTFGWKLIAEKINPQEEKKANEGKEFYFSELMISENSTYIGKPISELKELFENFAATFIKTDSRKKIITEGDKITVHTSPADLDEIRITLGLVIEDAKRLFDSEETDELEVLEVLVAESNNLLASSMTKPNVILISSKSAGLV